MRGVTDISIRVRSQAFSGSGALRPPPPGEPQAPMTRTKHCPQIARERNRRVMFGGPGCASASSRRPCRYLLLRRGAPECHAAARTVVDADGRDAAAANAFQNLTVRG